MLLSSIKITRSSATADSVHLTSLYRTVQKQFDMLYRFGVDHECDRQKDGRTDRLKNSADRSISIKLKEYTDFQTLNTPTQIRLMKVNCEMDLCRADAS